MTRILLVEDSDDILYILQLELNWMGYVVDIAANADEAIELAKKNRPDVIVSDLQMPVVDGLEFIKHIRRIPTLANVPAIALTGFSLEIKIQQALSSGFTAHLTKPVEATQLAKLIEQLTAVRLKRKAS